MKLRQPSNAFDLNTISQPSVLTCEGGGVDCEPWENAIARLGTSIMSLMSFQQKSLFLDATQDSPNGLFGDIHS